MKTGKNAIYEKFNNILAEKNLTLTKKARDIMEKDYGFLDEDNLETNVIRIAEIIQSLGSHSLPRQPKQAPKSIRRPSARTLNKRLHLVAFVIGETVAIGSGNKPTTWYILKSINWKEVCNAWNTAHPYDPKTPTNLKTRFYHYLRVPGVQKEFIVGRKYKPDMKFEFASIEWTGRTDKASSVTVEVPDMKAMRIKEPPLNPPTDIPGVPDAETIRRIRAEQTAKRIEKEKGGKAHDK